MISFRKAAVIASIFVIMGAVIQGAGASHTLGNLGAVNAIGGSFTLALAAAASVYIMTKFSLPVSTTQAIVGAIIGWNIFTGNPTDGGTLSKIIGTWISGPIIGALFAIVLYILLNKIKRVSRMHLIRFESYIRAGLIVVGAFGAYSLGANNIANVMGVFAPAFKLEELNLGIFSLSSGQQLFLLGGFAIAVGIMTYSKRVMETIGGNLLELTSEAAMVVVLAESLVLFIFSSTGLSNFFVRLGLPPIPMVPVSSSQVVVGCVLGIGIYKGVNNINFKLLGEIGIGWIGTPVLAGVIAFFSLFFMKNIFNVNVGYKVTDTEGLHQQVAVMGQGISDIIKYLLLGIFVIVLISMAVYYLLERKKSREIQKSDTKFWKYLK
jgi:phosphate/sulfate permease